MTPELRGAAFALALLCPVPSAYHSEGVPSERPAAQPSEHLSTAASSQTEPLGSPLAFFDPLSDLQVIRTTRGERPAVRAVQTRSPRGNE